MYQVTETHNSKSKQRKENTKSNSNFKEKDAIRKKKYLETHNRNILKSWMNIDTKKEELK